MVIFQHILELPSGKHTKNIWKDPPFLMGKSTVNGSFSIAIVIHCVYYILVGGLEHAFYFSIIYGLIIPTDELIFFRGVAQPP